MVKADEQRKLAEANDKNTIKEKRRAENLSKQLEDARRKIEELNTKTEGANYMDKTGEKEINLLKELLDKEKERADSVSKSAAEARKHLKAEKTKADKEKGNVDTERKMAEEYQAKFEALRKEANETKTRLLSEISEFKEENHKLKMKTSQLSDQLEDSTHKIEELQMQVHELLSSRSVSEPPSVLPGKDVNSKTRKMKLVQEKLKLAKMQLKYAKQMEKLETVRSCTLQQELGLIKLDSFKITQRLDALDKWLLSGTRFREDLEKVGLSNMQKPTLKRKLSDLEPFQMYAQSETELNPRCGALTSQNSLRQKLYCTDELLPTCERNRAEAISGKGRICFCIR